MDPRLPLLCLLLCWLPAQAQTVYKIVNPDGTVHYTDRRPADMDGVEQIRTRAEQQRLSNLRVEPFQGHRRAVAANLIDGPLQVELRFEGSHNIEARPALPLRVVIPAGSEQPLAEFGPQDPYQPSSFSLSLEAVPGDPGAQPEPVAYQMPVDTSEWRIDQGWNGRFSHQDEASRYAIDINVAEGTPVLAAREGRVMQVEDDFEGAGVDKVKFAGRANHVRVLHSDGSMAVYAHLLPESVVVRPGARVRTGQRLGQSGNTGYSTGPHLHFAIQVNRGMALQSIPFELVGPAGAVAIPEG